LWQEIPVKVQNIKPHLVTNLRRVSKIDALGGKWQSHKTVQDWNYSQAKDIAGLVSWGNN
jgi:NADP-dependent 3-hydroxy acid dehydrogenase YdfG